MFTLMAVGFIHAHNTVVDLAFPRGNQKMSHVNNNNNEKMAKNGSEPSVLFVLWHTSF